jgi:hypothetical protein
MTCIHYRAWRDLTPSKNLAPLQTDQCWQWDEIAQKCERNEDCPKEWEQPLQKKF